MLSEDKMTEMLQKCANGKIALHKMNTECSTLKKMKRIKEAFSLESVVKIGSQQYEHFADEKVLRDLFLQLKFCPIPAAFNEYCAKALK